MDPPCSQSSSRLLTLPLDVFQQITSYLGPSDLICMGMTCKALWSSTSANDIKAVIQKPISAWDRRMLLMKLARDARDMIACEFCLKLQPLVFNRARTMSNQWLKPPCPGLARQVSICQHVCITREMMEVVLDSHQPAHSTLTSAPDSLSHTCTWRTPGAGGTNLALQLASRVIDGELHLRLQYDIEIKVRPRGIINTPSMKGKGCLHSGIWLKKRCECALRHAAMGQSACSGCSTATRCAYCLTDFIVSAEKNSATSSSLHLQVRAYRYMGAGHHSHVLSDHVWQAQTRPLSTATPEESRQRFRNSPLEEIYERGGTGAGYWAGLSDSDRMLNLQESFRALKTSMLRFGDWPISGWRISRGGVQGNLR